MPSAATIFHYLTHPNELRAVAQYKIWHEPLHQRDTDKESTQLRRCYELLDLTSRSFSAVIQELQPEMRVAITLFYLILRGLDTIEDDMTLSLAVKEPILRSFHEILDQPGWTFDQNGPQEKDRQLLVEFDVVIEEFAKLKEVYRVVIKDITKDMGNGMADYLKDADHNLSGVQTVADYDRYCWYVAGLVGAGLTRLFVPAGVANPALLERPNLYSSMGLFLQKTNIIRDYAEDLADKRSFYPKEIWSKYVDNYVDLAKPEFEEAALNCNSDMVLNALCHADECIFYLAGLKDQSVFNFCAIPQTMAIATMAKIFRNPDIYHKNVKIPKGEACELMLEVGNLRSVCEVFRKYLHIIRKKNVPKDPNFLKISIACGKVEQFIESIFPSQPPITAADAVPAPPPVRQLAPDEREQTSGEVLFLMITIGATMLTMSAVMMFAAWLVGAKFDIAWDEIDVQLRDLPILGPFLRKIQGPGGLLGGTLKNVSGTATEAFEAIPEPLGDL